jgi:VIT1/CCC1 family predicted Fe2+/Mn2+ transporter
MNQKLFALIALFFLGLIAGVGTQYPTPFHVSETMSWAFTLLYGLAIFIWYRADANELSFKRSLWLNIAVVGFATGAIPYYLIRSRGWKRGLVAVCAAITVFLAICLFGSLGAMSAVAFRIYVLQQLQ